MIVMLVASGVLTAEKNSTRTTNRFVLETHVFVAEAQQPSSSNSTVFHDELIYDFPNGGQSVTVLDMKAREFVLLDLKLQVKTQITLDQLKLYESWLADVALRQDDPLLRFCAEPEFEVKQDDDQVSFQSPLMTYTVSGVRAKEKELVERYRQFTDWYARLNSMMNPRALPPTARLTVNEHLAQSGAVPSRIELKLAPHARFGRESLKLRSDHQWRSLESGDIDRINATQRQLDEFRAVPLDEFRRQSN